MGFGIEGDIAKIYNNYINKHPEYNVLSLDAVYLRMKEEGVITQEQYNTIKKGLIFDFKSQKSNTDNDWKSILGFNAAGTNKKNNRVNTKNCPTPLVPVKYHSKFSDLEIDNNGSIKNEQFEFNYLKTRYLAAGYSVKQTKEGSIVYKNGEHYLEYKKDKFGAITYNIYKNGKVNQSVEIIKGKIANSITYNEDGSSACLRYVKGNTNKIYSRTDNYSNGKNTITYYRENGDIEYVLDDRGRIDYAGNKPFSQLIGAEKTFPGLQTLKNAIKFKDFKLVKKIVEQGIHSGNVLKVLEEYEKLGQKSDLLKDLKIFGTNGVNLIENIEQTIAKTGTQGVGYIAKALYYDMKGLGSGDLERHIKMINKDNVGPLMEAYKRTAYNETVGGGHSNGLKNIEDLLTAIEGEWIDPHKKSLMRNHIIKAAMENSKNKFVGDIKRDIDEHVKNKDWHKLTVDLVRICQRAENSGEVKFIKPNGKFDSPADQKGSGDCYLVSTVNAMIAKPALKKKLEDMITILSNGDAKITMKGNNKTYYISADDIKNSNYLSSGDGDMRIIEIAYDRYVRDEAYADKDFIEKYGVGDGGIQRCFLEALFGEQNDENYMDVAAKDFDPKSFNSNPKTAYVFCVGPGIISAHGAYYAINSKGEKVYIEHKHGYSVVGVNDKGIQIINPWHSSDVLTVTYEEFEKMKDDAVFIDATKID